MSDEIRAQIHALEEEVAELRRRADLPAWPAKWDDFVRLPWQEQAEFRKVDPVRVKKMEDAFFRAINTGRRP